MKQTLRTLGLSALLLSAAASMASAQSQLQMAFATTDGTVSTIEARSLTMSVNDGRLVASNGTNSLTFELQKLAKMYFTDKISGVEIIAANFNDGSVAVYSTDGKYVGKYDSDAAAHSSLLPGNYILQTTGNRTIKIAVQ